MCTPNIINAINKIHVDYKNGGRVRVGVRCNSREIEIRNDQEECGASDEDIVVVLYGDQLVVVYSIVVVLTSLMLAKAVGPASVIPTFTMK